MVILSIVTLIKFVFISFVIFSIVLLLGMDSYVPVVEVDNPFKDKSAVSIYWFIPFGGLVLGLICLLASIKQWKSVLIALPIAMLGQMVFYFMLIYGFVYHFKTELIAEQCIGYLSHREQQDVFFRCSKMMNGFNEIMVGAAVCIINSLVDGIFVVLRWRMLRSLETVKFFSGRRS